MTPTPALKVSGSTGAPFVARAKLGYTGCPNVSRWVISVIIARRCPLTPPPQRPPPTSSTSSSATTTLPLRPPPPIVFCLSFFFIFFFISARNKHPQWFRLNRWRHVHCRGKTPRQNACRDTFLFLIVNKDRQAYRQRTATV